MCYVFKQLIINKPAGYIPIDTERIYDLSGGRGD